MRSEVRVSDSESHLSLVFGCVCAHDMCESLDDVHQCMDDHRLTYPRPPDLYTHFPPTLLADLVAHAADPSFVDVFKEVVSLLVWPARMTATPSPSLKNLFFAADEPDDVVDATVASGVDTVAPLLADALELILPLIPLATQDITTPQATMLPPSFIFACLQLCWATHHGAPNATEASLLLALSTRLSPEQGLLATMAAEARGADLDDVVRAADALAAGALPGLNPDNLSPAIGRVLAPVHVVEEVDAIAAFDKAVALWRIYKALAGPDSATRSATRKKLTAFLVRGNQIDRFDRTACVDRIDADIAPDILRIGEWRRRLGFCRERAFGLPSELDAPSPSFQDAANGMDSMEELTALLVRGMLNQAAELLSLCGVENPGGWDANCAVLGLGSLARGEMCPFSDLDAVLLLAQDTPVAREYATHLWTVVQWISIGLGETPWDELVPSKYGYPSPIPSSSVQGFRLDEAALSPLRTMETPASLAALQAEAAGEMERGDDVDPFKHSLRTVVCLAGSEALVSAYHNAIVDALDEPRRKAYALATLQRNLAAFGSFETLALGSTIDIKSELCRFVSLTIDGLALFYGIREPSTAERVRQLGIRDTRVIDDIIAAAQTVFAVRAAAHVAAGYESEDVEVTEELVGIVARICVPLHAAVAHLVESSGDDSDFWRADGFRAARFDTLIRSVASVASEVDSGDVAGSSSAPPPRADVAPEGSFVRMGDPSSRWQLTEDAMAALQDNANRESHGRAEPSRVDGLHWKFTMEPELAHIEVLVHRMGVAMFGVDLTPVVEIVRLQWVGSEHVVIVSETAEGVTLLDALESDDEQVVINQACFSAHVLLSAVVNPEDGKADNFVWSADSGMVSSVDNDHAFVAPLVESGRHWIGRRTWRKPRVKSVLFCMDEMRGNIERGVQAMIAKMDPAEVLEWWTSELDAVQAMLPKERMKDGLVAVLFHKLCALQSVMCVSHGIPHDLALRSVYSSVFTDAYVTARVKDVDGLERFLTLAKDQYKSASGRLVTQTPARAIMAEQGTVAPVRSNMNDAAQRAVDVGSSRGVALVDLAGELATLGEEEAARLLAAFLETRDSGELAGIRSVRVWEELLATGAAEGVAMERIVIHACSGLDDATLKKLVEGTGARGREWLHEAGAGRDGVPQMDGSNPDGECIGPSDCERVPGAARGARGQRERRGCLGLCWGVGDCGWSGGYRSG